MMISVHAEVAAMNKVNPDHLRGATVFVARMGRKNGPALSRPCDRCHKALVKAGVRQVIYTH